MGLRKHQALVAGEGEGYEELRDLQQTSPTAQLHAVSLGRGLLSACASMSSCLQHACKTSTCALLAQSSRPACSP